MFFPENELPGRKHSVKSNPRRIKDPASNRAHGMMDQFVKAGIFPQLSIPARGAMVKKALIEVNLLIKEHGLSKVNKTIKKYIEYKDDEYIPRVWSLQTFCLKYLQIEDFLHTKEEYYSPKRVTNTALEIRKRLDEYYINRHMEKIICRSIQTSMRNYERMIKALKSMRIRSEYARFILEYCTGYAPENKEFIYQWFANIFSSTRVLDSNNPDPRQITFSLHSYQFRKDIKFLWLPDIDINDLTQFLKELTHEYVNKA
jgi:hypothetical protein